MELSRREFLAASAAVPFVLQDAARKRTGDGTQAAPRMRIFHNAWSLIGLPRGGPEWSIEEKVKRVKEAGFEGIECWQGMDAPAMRKALEDNGLAIAMGFHPNSVDDFKKMAKVKAEYVIIQAGNAFMSDEEMTTLARDGLKVFDDAGVAGFIEIHRGTLTESPYRTLKLVERVPEIRFTGDFSHWIISGEMGGWSIVQFSKVFGPVLDRVESIQARVSNGEQVQIDVGDGSKNAHGKRMVRIWTECLRRWRARAKPGDWFPFASELGPVTYSIQDLSGAELSDRWEQSLVMKKLGEQAWEKSAE